MENQPEIYQPKEQIPETDLDAIAEITEDDINDAVQKWVDNPPDEGFENILEAKSE